MSERSDSEREALLERVLCGELPRDDPAVAKAVAADPTLGRELDGLLALRDGLDAPDERRDVLVEARRDPWHEGEALARRAIEAALDEVTPTRTGPRDATSEPPPGESARPAARPRWMASALLAAAAAVLAAVLWPDGRPPITADPAPVVYLGDTLPGAAPAGEVSDYARFEWTLELPAGWSAELKVFDDSPTASSSAPLASERVAVDGDWAPDPARAERWPDAIRWTLTPVGPDGSRRSPYGVRAWRSSP